MYSGLGTVSAYLARATAAGLTWPLPADLDDAALEARLFARPADAPGLDRTVPAWPHLHQELKRPAWACSRRRGQRDDATSRFAEALWLNPQSSTAREGLARAVAFGR